MFVACAYIGNGMLASQGFMYSYVRWNYHESLHPSISVQVAQTHGMQKNLQSYFLLPCALSLRKQNNDLPLKKLINISPNRLNIFYEKLTTLSSVFLEDLFSLFYPKIRRILLNNFFCSKSN